MNLFKKQALLLLAFIGLSAHAGGSLDLSLSNDAVRLGYDAALIGSESHISMNALHHIDSGDNASVGFHIVGQKDVSSPLFVGIGGQVMGSHYRYKSDEEKKDYTSLGLGVGAFVRYNLPSHPPLGISTHFYYSPAVITFSDGKSMLDADLRLQYSVIPSAHVYIGYRYNAFQVKKIDKWYAVDKGFHLGLRLNF